MSPAPDVPLSTADLRRHVEGGYRYIPNLFQYSSGVAAEPGFELERVRFHQPVPLQEGFAAVESHLRAIGRPVAALAQCELRSPRPYSEQGFLAFNQAYAQILSRWDLCDGVVTPVARTHVCPVYDPPPEPALHAFSYTVPAVTERRSFVLAGGGDVRRGPGTFLERCVRPGDTSPEGLREKVRHVIGEMERRMSLLGFGWAEAVGTQCYTVQNIGHLVGEELAARGAMPGGLLWSYALLPVEGLAFEMDVRGTVREHVV
jgi:hypothetical protein